MPLAALREWQPLLLRALWGIHFHRDGGAATAAAAASGIAPAMAPAAAEHGGRRLGPSRAVLEPVGGAGGALPLVVSKSSVLRSKSSLTLRNRSSVSLGSKGPAGVSRASRLGLRHPEGLGEALSTPVLRALRSAAQPISEHLLWRSM